MTRDFLPLKKKEKNSFRTKRLYYNLIIITCLEVSNPVALAEFQIRLDIYLGL